MQNGKKFSICKKHTTPNTELYLDIDIDIKRRALCIKSFRDIWPVYQTTINRKTYNSGIKGREINPSLLLVSEIFSEISCSSFPKVSVLVTRRDKNILSLALTP